MHVLEREKRQANVSVASGFVLITAIIFYPFVIYHVPPHTHLVITLVDYRPRFPG